MTPQVGKVYTNWYIYSLVLAVLGDLVITLDYYDESGNSERDDHWHHFHHSLEQFSQLNWEETDNTDMFTDLIVDYDTDNIIKREE